MSHVTGKVCPPEVECEAVRCLNDRWRREDAAAKAAKDTAECVQPSTATGLAPRVPLPVGVSVETGTSSEDAKRFLILDGRTCVGNCALFWAPNGQGYTTQLDEAGLYTEDEANGHRDTDIPIPEELAKAASVTHVRSDRLRSLMADKGIPWEGGREREAWRKKRLEAIEALEQEAKVRTP